MYETKGAAVEVGGKRAMRDRTEHVIHKMDGEFGERRSYGTQSGK